MSARKRRIAVICKNCGHRSSTPVGWIDVDTFLSPCSSCGAKTPLDDGEAHRLVLALRALAAEVAAKVAGSIDALDEALGPRQDN